MKVEMRAALLFRLGGLGDLLVALPSLNLLRKSFQGLSLHLVGRAAYGGLLREAGVVDDLFSAAEAQWAPLYDSSNPVPEELDRWLSRYDLIMGWFHSKTGGMLGTHHRVPELKEVSPKFFVYDPASRVSVSRYFFDGTAEFIREKGRPVFSFEECCSLPSAETHSRGKSVVIHPGSGSPRKCWPLDRFFALTRFFQHLGFSGTVVTGEAEERLEEEIRHVSLPPGWRWRRCPPLRELVFLLRSAVFYIGNDSGVTHLAAACGTNVIAIFRKEMETAWKPFGITTVLSADEVEQIVVEDVMAVIDQILQPGS